MLAETLAIVTALTLTAFYLGRKRASLVAGGNISSLHSRPVYHGFHTALLTLLLGFVVALVVNYAAKKYVNAQIYAALPAQIQKESQLRKDKYISDAKAIVRGDIVSRAGSPEEKALRHDLVKVITSYQALQNWSVLGAALLASLAGFLYSYRKIRPSFRARNRSERIVRFILIICAGTAILATIGILLSLIGETLKFFQNVPLWKFLFGTHWSPLSGVHEGVINPDTVGALPLLAGTLLITIIAMLVAVPVGLFAAIYLSEYASARARSFLKPMLEILAGIPTVVYGFFAAITVAPFIRQMGDAVGVSVASQSALAAGLVMGIMIIPFISSLSDDVINAVPQTLRDGSMGLGATKAETVTKVVLPAALPGIVSAVILAVSRAVGETMIVVMAAGQGVASNWHTFNPLESATTVTVQIVMLITGDTEADTAAGPAFALGFTLFCITLLLNIVAIKVVKKYREKYD